MPPPRLFTFFALAGPSDAPEVYRLPLTHALQRELSLEFSQQLEAFGIDEFEHIDYASNPQYHPEEGELFELRRFSLPATIPDLTSAPAISSLSDDQIESGAVRGLIGVPQGSARSNELLCFQAVDNRQLIRRSKFGILLSGDVFSKNDKSGIVVRDSLTAVYRGGSLYFPLEPPVRRFLDMSQVFTEATDPQVKRFLGHNIFSVENKDAVIELATKWARRKIASIEGRGILRKVPVAKVVRAGKEFGVGVAIKRVNGEPRIVVPADKVALKDLLRLLDQDFLVSTITPDRFRANSKLRL